MAVWLRLKSVPSAPPRVDSMLSKCINGQYFRRNYLVMQMGHPFTPLVCGFWGDVCNSCELLLLDSWQLFNQHCNVDNLSQQWIYETPESVQWFPFSFHESCLSMSILPNVVKCGEYISDAPQLHHPGREMGCPIIDLSQTLDPSNEDSWWHTGEEQRFLGFLGPFWALKASNILQLVESWNAFDTFW